MLQAIVSSTERTRISALPLQLLQAGGFLTALTSHHAVFQGGLKPLDPDEEFSLELLGQAGGLPSIIAELSSPSLRTQQQAAGALWLLTSKDCSPIQTQPDQLQQILDSLIAHMSFREAGSSRRMQQVLWQNLAGHPTLQSRFTEAQGPLGVLLKLLVKGSPLTQDNCARALEQLAACHVPSQEFCQFPILAALIFLLTDLATSVQLVSLRILQKLLVSWFKDDLRARRVSMYDAHSQAYQAAQQFIGSRGLISLNFLLQKPETEELAATCLNCLVRLKLSWPAFASSGTFELLLQRLALPTPSKESSAGSTQTHAADAVAILVEDADCAKIALQPPNLKLILQPFNAASIVLWESALQILTALMQTDEKRQTFAAAGVMKASVVESMLFETAGCCSSTTEVMQAQVLVKLSLLSSCHQSLVDGGGIVHLSKKLDSPSQNIQRHASNAIALLASCDAAIRQKCAEGNIPRKLIRLLQCDVEQCQDSAARALGNLAVSKEHADSLANLGSLPPLIKLLSSASSELKVQSAGAITAMCSHTEAIRLQALQLGAVTPLMAMSASSQADVKIAGQKCLNRLAGLGVVKSA